MACPSLVLSLELGPSLRRLRAWLSPLGLMAAAASIVLAPWPAVAKPRGEVLAGPPRAGSDLLAARRCLDQQLGDAGLRELSIAVDALPDATRPGDDARELAVQALGELGARSRALRAGLFAKNEPGWARHLLRGSIRPDSADGRVLALELSLVDARDRSSVPGSASRQVVRIVPPSDGQEGRLEFRKFGTPYSLRMAGDDHASAVTRPLLELGTLETVGRLARVPYWICLGGSLEHPDVQEETQDWYDQMAARPVELIGFFQQRLRQLSIYEGALDGVNNARLADAVMRTREALGLSREPKLTLDFFRAFLVADAAALTARLSTAQPVSPAPAVTPAPAPGGNWEAVAPERPGLKLAAASDTQRMARDEPLRLVVRPQRDAHVYCFHQDENRRIRRFFPNRFQPDSRVAADAGLQLPGKQPFEIVMNARGVPEAVACLATPSDVLDQLPPALAGKDFEVLRVASMDQLREAFARLPGGLLGYETLQMRPR